MSVRSKLLQEIDKKAQKIRDKRVEAASNKSIESAVFEFFKNIEECRKMYNNVQYDPHLFFEAKKALEERIQGYAPGTKISIEWNTPNNETPSSVSWAHEMVRGVTIWWSKAYVAKNNVDPSLYMDVSQALFF